MEKQTILLLSIVTIIALTGLIFSEASSNEITGQISLKKVVKKWQKEIAKAVNQQPKPSPVVSPTLTQPLPTPKPPSTPVTTSPLMEIKYLPEAANTQKFPDSSPVHTTKLPEGFGV